MANESTFAIISDLLPDIWEMALFYAQSGFVMPRLVTGYSDMSGMVPRKISEYVETAVTDNLAETADLSTARVTFDRGLRQTLTPKEIGKQFIITDRRVESDLENVMADASRDLGYTMGKKVEQDLLGQFADFQGGVFGDESQDMTMEQIFAARARLEAADIPGPYFTVIHPYQFFQLWQAFNDLSNPAPLPVRATANASYYVTNIADVQIVVSTLVPIVSVQNETQVLTEPASTSGGTFAVAFRNASTGDTIPFNASAATVQAALEALYTIGTGNVSVAGSAGGPYTVTFQGKFAGQDVELMTAPDGSLTGGATDDIIVTAGVSPSSYARGGIFTRDALAFDLRRGLRVEPERDASARWTELNASMIYAASEWRAERGIELRSNSTGPDTF